MIKKREKNLILISRRNLIVSTTEENPNKLFLFFKSRQEKPPTYDEVLGEEGTEWLQVTQSPSARSPAGSEIFRAEVVLDHWAWRT